MKKILLLLSTISIFVSYMASNGHIRGMFPNLSIENEMVILIITFLIGMVSICFIMSKALINDNNYDDIDDID